MFGGWGNIPPPPKICYKKVTKLYSEKIHKKKVKKSVEGRRFFPEKYFRS